MAEKTRYSDAELEEFRAIIMEKLELAERDYERLKSSIMNKDGRYFPYLQSIGRRCQYAVQRRNDKISCTSVEIHSGTASCFNPY